MNRGRIVAETISTNGTRRAETDGHWILTDTIFPRIAYLVRRLQSVLTATDSAVDFSSTSHHQHTYQSTLATVAALSELSPV